MLVECRVAYPVPEEIRRDNLLIDHRVRYAKIPIEMPLITEQEAPVALVVTRPDGRTVEYRNHQGILKTWSGEILIEEPDAADPIMLFSIAIGNIFAHALPETRNEAEACRKERGEMIEGARRWASMYSVIRDEDGDLLCLRRATEPIIVVSPPHDSSNGPWTNPDHLNTVPCLKVDYHPDREGTIDVYQELLRHDRWFAIDELDDAALRAKEFGKKLSRGRTKFDVRDRSCFVLEPSVLALRLTAREAIKAAKTSDQTIGQAKSALLDVIDDQDANAAAICPRARHFLASFGSSTETLSLSSSPKIAPCLERLQRAYDRAQRRMASNLIPAEDARRLDDEDDAALGRFGM